MAADTVPESVYLSAVHGRREMRQGLREARARIANLEAVIESALRAADAGDLPAVRGALGAFRSGAGERDEG